jgi:hypothetical protein
MFLNLNNFEGRSNINTKPEVVATPFLLWTKVQNSISRYTECMLMGVEEVGVEPSSGGEGLPTAVYPTH